jgi:hypothetical protein
MNTKCSRYFQWSLLLKHCHYHVSWYTCTNRLIIILPCVFICGSYNDTFNTTDYAASNSRIFNEQWIGKDIKESSYGLILRCCSVTCLKGLMNACHNCVCFSLESTSYVPNTNKIFTAWVNPWLINNISISMIYLIVVFTLKISNWMLTWLRGLSTLSDRLLSKMMDCGLVSEVYCQH